MRVCVMVCVRVGERGVCVRVGVREGGMRVRVV